MKKMAIMLLSCLCFVAGSSVAAPKTQEVVKKSNKSAKPVAKSKVAQSSKVSKRAVSVTISKNTNVKNLSKNKMGKSRATARISRSTSIAQYNPSNIKYVIFDYKTGKVLEEKNSHEVWPLASLTKLMTAHVFLNNHKNIGNCKAMITEEDKDNLKFTRTRLKKDTEYECGELLEAMLTVSDNYAASALARAIPGWSKKDFIAEMNKQAVKWDLRTTRFVDSSGLSPLNVSSANDYYKLTRNVAHTPFLSDLSTIKTKMVETVSGHETQINNTNPLVRNGWKTIVSKTGYIKESGYNLAFVSDCETPVGLIEFGANTSRERIRFASDKLKQYGCN